MRQRFSLRRVVIVADRGVVSRDIIQELEKEKTEYIFGGEAEEGQGSSQQGTTASYREVLCDIEQLKAVCFEARGKKWLWRNELPDKAYDSTFQSAAAAPF